MLFYGKLWKLIHLIGNFMNTAEILIQRLMDYFNVDTVATLSTKLQIGQPSISKWKKNNSINAIRKKCRELNIYDEIFKNIAEQNIKNNSGINSINNYGDQVQNSSNHSDIDNATFNLFKEAYLKALEEDKLKKFRLYLMEYE